MHNIAAISGTKPSSVVLQRLVLKVANTPLKSYHIETHRQEL
jgi:hypothetical protein